MTDQPYYRYDSFHNVAAPQTGDPVIFYRRTVNRDPSPPAIAEKDFKDLVADAAAFTVTRLTPRSLWEPYNTAATRLRLKVRLRRDIHWFEKAVAAVLDIHDPIEAEQLYIKFRHALHRRRMMLAHDIAGRRYPIEIELAGAANLKNALERGKGAIVWAGPTTPQGLVGKRALWEARFRPVQISTPNHGNSATRFGRLVVNKPIIRAENQYLSDRIVFEPDKGPSVTRRILKILNDGGLVVLTHNTFAGSIFMELPLGPAGFFSMPTTAPGIALKYGVPLLCMNTIEVEPFHRYRATISATITSQDATSGSRHAKGGRDYTAMAAIAVAARDHVLAGIHAAPDQYMFWSQAFMSVLDYPKQEGE